MSFAHSRSWRSLSRPSRNVDRKRLCTGCSRLNARHSSRNSRAPRARSVMKGMRPSYRCGTAPRKRRPVSRRGAERGELGDGAAREGEQTTREAGADLALVRPALHETHEDRELMGRLPEAAGAPPAALALAGDGEIARVLHGRLEARRRRRPAERAHRRRAEERGGTIQPAQNRVEIRGGDMV